MGNYPLGKIGDLQTSRGPIQMWRLVHEGLCAYIAVSHWMPPSQRVIMYVAALPIPERFVVNLVYAPESIRFDPVVDNEVGVSLAVQIGRWLFENRHLTHHSPDRNDHGERWAQQVGGVLTERLPEGHPHAGASEAVSEKAERWYRELCSRPEWEDLT